MSAGRVEPWRQHAIEIQCICSKVGRPCQFHRGYRDGFKAGGLFGERTQDELRAEVAARDATIEELREALRNAAAPCNRIDGDCCAASYHLNSKMMDPWMAEVVAAALLDVPDRSVAGVRAKTEEDQDG